MIAGVLLAGGGEPGLGRRGVGDLLMPFCKLLDISRLWKCNPQALHFFEGPAEGIFSTHSLSSVYKPSIRRPRVNLFSDGTGGSEPVIW